jgi:phosphatidylglycerol---prolipoprotein diacylglyceryl transferase
MTPPDLSRWYHHDLDPIAFRAGDVSIPYYWLVYVLGWFWCAWVLKKTASQVAAGSDERHLVACQSDFLLWGWIALIVGSRFIYIVLYNPSHYFAHPNEVLALWNGGMSFHGGFAGVAIAAWVVSRMRGASIFALTDPLTIAVPWVLALGRLANFANGELAGRITTVPWAVVFPAPFDGAPRHPSQIYEAIFEGVVLGSILFYHREKLLARRGYASFAFTGLYAAARFFVEFTREPDPQIGLIGGMTMGQYLCLGMILVAVVGAANLNTQGKIR